MREYRFRGKATVTGDWAYGWYAKCFRPFHADADVIITEKGETIEVDPETVGQYTGKKVKTGKIFEGDIGKSIDGIFLVVWDEEKCAFMMQFYDYPDYPNERLYLEEMWDDSEIIGNIGTSYPIHDNPELLKEVE